jgi:hypothetical protein
MLLGITEANRQVPECRVAAIAFNKSLNIPVKWKVAQKARYKAGRGMYDYVDPRSDYHILLFDDMKTGRLKRSRGEFLCTAKVKPKDKDLHQVINMNEMNVEQSKHHKVTCSNCLKYAIRFQK